MPGLLGSGKSEGAREAHNPERGELSALPVKANMESRGTATDGQGAGPGLHPSSSEDADRGPKANRPPGRGAALGPGPAQATSRKWRQRQARACPGARTRMSALGVRMRLAEWIRAPRLLPPPEPRADGSPGSLHRASSSASRLTAASELLPRPVHHRSCLSPGAPREAAARPGHVTARGRAPFT